MNVDMNAGQNGSNSKGVMEDSKTNGTEFPKNNPYLLQERGGMIYIARANSRPF